MVEWFVGQYQSGDGVLYGGDDSFGVTGDGGWDELYCSADVQLGAGIIAHSIGIIAAGGNRDAVCLLVLE